MARALIADIHGQVVGVKVEKSEEIFNKFSSYRGFGESEEHYTLIDESLEQFKKAHGWTEIQPPSALAFEEIGIGGMLFNKATHRFNSFVINEEGAVTEIELCGKMSKLTSPGVYELSEVTRKVKPTVYSLLVEALGLNSLLSEGDKLNPKYKGFTKNPVLKCETIPSSESAYVIQNAVVDSETFAKVELQGYFELNQETDSIVTLKALTAGVQSYDGGYVLFDKDAIFSVDIDDLIYEDVESDDAEKVAVAL